MLRNLYFKAKVSNKHYYITDTFIIIIDTRMEITKY